MLFAAGALAAGGGTAGGRPRASLTATATGVAPAPACGWFPDVVVAAACQACEAWAVCVACLRCAHHVCSEVQRCRQRLPQPPCLGGGHTPRQWRPTHGCVDLLDRKAGRDLAGMPMHALCVASRCVYVCVFGRGSSCERHVLLVLRGGASSHSCNACTLHSRARPQRPQRLGGCSRRHRTEHERERCPRRR